LAPPPHSPAGARLPSGAAFGAAGAARRGGRRGAPAGGWRRPGWWLSGRVRRRSRSRVALVIRARFSRAQSAMARHSERHAAAAGAHLCLLLAAAVLTGGAHGEPDCVYNSTRPAFSWGLTEGVVDNADGCGQLGR